MSLCVCSFLQIGCYTLQGPDHHSTYYCLHHVCFLFIVVAFVCVLGNALSYRRIVFTLLCIHSFFPPFRVWHKSTSIEPPNTLSVTPPLAPTKNAVNVPPHRSPPRAMTAETLPTVAISLTSLHSFNLLPHHSHPLYPH